MESDVRRMTGAGGGRRCSRRSLALPSVVAVRGGQPPPPLLQLLPLPLSLPFPCWQPMNLRGRVMRRDVCRAQWIGYLRRSPTVVPPASPVLAVRRAVVSPQLRRCCAAASQNAVHDRRGEPALGYGGEDAGQPRLRPRRPFNSPPSGPCQASEAAAELSGSCLCHSLAPPSPARKAVQSLVETDVDRASNPPVTRKGRDARKKMREGVEAWRTHRRAANIALLPPRPSDSRHE